MSERQQPTPYPLRMPDELRQKLQADADFAGRSLQAEILRRLELSLSSDPLALDPAQLQISIPNDLYNQLRYAAVTNGTIPNEELTNRLTASFDPAQHQDNPAPMFSLALRLADSQGLFAGVLASMCRRVLEVYTPEVFGLSKREYDEVYRLLSKSVHRIDYDESDMTRLIGIASLLGAIVPKKWPDDQDTKKGSSDSEDPLRPPTKGPPAPEGPPKPIFPDHVDDDAPLQGRRLSQGIARSTQRAKGSVKSTDPLPPKRPSKKNP